MAAADPRIDTYFAQAGKWQAEQAALRAILLATPLAEEFKWRAPCYTFSGSNVATIWGLKDYCGLSFFKGVLLKDPKGILVAPGKNSRSVRLARFTDVAEIGARASVLKSYVLESIENEKRGLKVDFPKDDLELPQELRDKFNQDDAFRTAFKALTPGRQRGYVLHFSQPKQSATRTSRIDRCAPRILDGKGMHDR
jgi:uncharacterized protein YdeI (YjbR/CyaY-like superfamily)